MDVQLPAPPALLVRAVFFGFVYQLFSEGGPKAGITAFAIEGTDLAEAHAKLDGNR